MKSKRWFKISRLILKNKHFISQYLAEFIGTFFLVFFGCGAIILSETMSGYDASFIPIIFGGTVSIMIYAVGHISGAHFNPAVTLAFFALKLFPAKKLMGYLGAQFFGAFFASTIHYFIWGNGHSFGVTSFSTSIEMAFILEVLLSFILMFVIVSVATDSRAVGELAGIAIGSTVALCAFVGGPLTGASMNPARSLAPAVLSGEMNSIYLYLIAPCVGAISGAFVYHWIRCQKENVTDERHGCC